MNFLVVNVAAGANRALARSALPDAPVVEDKPRSRRVRTAIRAVRRAFAAPRTAPDDGRPARGAHAGKTAESC
jgi:hypothetical protein